MKYSFPFNVFRASEPNYQRNSSQIHQ
uniref:Uncharacterized protein n=1 Tax=Anguilla anguilla TaxID=7936 RepID=A0A0E9UXA1_ANGAN